MKQLGGWQVFTNKVSVYTVSILRPNTSKLRNKLIILFWVSRTSHYSEVSSVVRPGLKQIKTIWIVTKGVF